MTTIRDGTILFDKSIFDDSLFDNDVTRKTTETDVVSIVSVLAEYFKDIEKSSEVVSVAYVDTEYIKDIHFDSTVVSVGSTLAEFDIKHDIRKDSEVISVGSVETEYFKNPQYDSVIISVGSTEAEGEQGHGFHTEVVSVGSTLAEYRINVNMASEIISVGSTQATVSSGTVKSWDSIILSVGSVETEYHGVMLVELGQGNYRYDTINSTTNEKLGKEIKDNIMFRQEFIMAADFPTKVTEQLRDGAARLRTTLTDDVLASASTIHVDATSGFPSTGFITINNETKEYTGKTSTTFTGCATVNGVDTAHDNGDDVLCAISAEHINRLNEEMVAVQENVVVAYDDEGKQKLKTWDKENDEWAEVKAASGGIFVQAEEPEEFEDNDLWFKIPAEEE